MLRGWIGGVGRWPGCGTERRRCGRQPHDRARSVSPAGSGWRRREERRLGFHGGVVFRGWFGGKGVEAGARHGEAKPTAHTARRGGGWGGGKKRPVNSGERRLLGLARGERARAPGARESWGNGRGDHGDRFYGPGKAGSRPDVAESAGEVGRRRGVVEGLTGADFRGESGGEKVEEVEGINFTRSWGGVERGSRGVVGLNRRPWGQLGRREVGEEDDRWGLGSHLSWREGGENGRGK